MKPLLLPLNSAEMGLGGNLTAEKVAVMENKRLC